MLISILFDTDESCEKNIPENIRLKYCLWLPITYHAQIHIFIIEGTLKTLLSFFSETRSRIFLEYWILFTSVSWIKIPGKIKDNFVTWNCLLRFIDFMFEKYLEWHSLHLNIFKFAWFGHFSLFGNFTWYCSMGILFEKQHDKYRENCSNFDFF